YLNKVIEAEALGYNDLWRKNILHLSGGIQPIELFSFKLYLDGFGDIAKGPYYGGSIKTIGKQEANPVELINISEEVNNGVNFITFFGHSSPNTIDIDIGFATDPVLGYNNPGKYPAFLINGCNTGVAFSNGTVFGEDWVMAVNKGARSFIAHSSFGSVNTLRAYTQLFYEVGFGDSTYIQSGIGDIQKEVARRYLQVNATSISSVTQVQQMLMLGDPAVKLFGATKPDYETANSQLFLESFDGSPVTALTDSFALKIITKNYGFVSKQPLKVRVIRTYNDQSVFSYDTSFNSISSIDTLAVLIKKEEGLTGFGSNQFLVELDYENEIDELNEDNNTGLLSLFIPLSGTKNLLPRPYEVVSSTVATLKWQNTNLLSLSRVYDVELDTVDTFASPFLQSFTITGKALLSHQVTLLDQDSLAYYWRTRLSADENAEWATSSFNYIANGNEGWAQIHFPQFKGNVISGIVKDNEQRQFDFSKTSIALFVNNFGSSHPSPLTTSFKINGAEYNLATQGQPCRTNTINFVAFDKTTLVPYAGIPFIFQDPRTCGREPQVINSFTLSELETGNNDDLLQYIDNIDVSDSVVIFSIADAGYPSWPSGAIAKMGELGISNLQIASLEAGEPIVIFGKKGSAAGTAVVIKATGSPINEQELQVSRSLTGKFTSGTMSSSLIGPAADWQSFTSFIRNNSANDSYYFDLFGVSLSGEEALLLGGVTGTSDLSSIAASEFPYLKMVLHTTDDVDQTPIQLHQWIVSYTPVAEGFLLYNGTTQSVSKQERETWSASYSFLNISNKLFSDSLLVNFNTLNKSLRVSDSKIFNIKQPTPGDTTHFSVVVDTRHKTGLNDVNIFVNNRVLPEQYYENNIL
ncbi:MAG TPA: C25 family cysteine peptidase, partial [Cyclobacteriaceae bacterium]